MTGSRAKRVKSLRPIAVGFLGPGIHFTGNLVDLSETGALVRCRQQDVALDTVGRLGIDLGKEVLRTVAVVRRRVPGVGLGLRISHMSPTNRDRLRRLLFLLSSYTPYTPKRTRAPRG